MRKILNFTRLAVSAIARNIHRNRVTAAVASACLALGTMHPVGAQTYSASYTQAANLVAPTAMAQRGSSVLRLGEIPAAVDNSPAVVDSTFRSSNRSAGVTSASYLGDMGLKALHAAECRPVGYGPNASCNARWYFGFDALWLRREGLRRYSLTQNAFLDDTEYEFGGRYTVGKLCDCVNAYEFVYAGPFRWLNSSETIGAANVESKFNSTPIGLSTAFNDADRHVQQYRSSLDSYELNKRWWAWDAVSTMIGVRYTNYRDRYSLQSFRTAAPVSGTYQDNVSNDLVGLQIGGNLFLPTSLRTSVNFKAKGGLFANFASRTVDLIENNASILKNGFDKTDLAGLVEFGVSGIYQFTPSVSIQGGYEFWYMPGLATVSNQRNSFLDLNTGSNIRMDHDILIHGFSVGAQILY
jgi:hypothetical protein